MLRRFWKWLRRALLAVLLLLALVAAVLYWRGEAWLRAALESALQAQLQPPARLAAAHWQLWPQQRLRVHGLSIGAEAAPQLQVDSVEVLLDRDALRRGQIVIDTLAVSGVELHLQRLADGSWNVDHWLQPRRAAAGTPPALPALRAVDGRALRLRIDAVDGVPAVEVAIATLTLSAAVDVLDGGALVVDAEVRSAAPQAHARAEMAVDYRIDGGALWVDMLTLEGGGEARLAASPDAPVEHWQVHEATLEGRGWQFAGGGVRAAEHAAAALRLSGAGRQLRLRGALDAFAWSADWRLSGWLAAELDAPAITLHSTVAAVPGRFEGQVDGRAEGSALRGGWRYDGERKPPVQLDLAIDEVDGEAWRAHLPADAGGGGSTLPDWQSWPLQGRVHIGRLRLGEVLAEDVVVSLD